MLSEINSDAIKLQTTTPGVPQQGPLSLVRAARIRERLLQREVETNDSVPVRPDPVAYVGWKTDPYVVAGLQGLEKDVRALAEIFHLLAETEREWNQNLSDTLQVASWQQLSLFAESESKALQEWKNLLPRVDGFLHQIIADLQKAWDQLHVPSTKEALRPIQEDAETSLGGLEEDLAKGLHQWGVEVKMEPEGLAISIDEPHFLQGARENPAGLAEIMERAAKAFEVVAGKLNQDADLARSVIEQPGDLDERLASRDQDPVLRQAWEKK